MGHGYPSVNWLINAGVDLQASTRLQIWGQPQTEKGTTSRGDYPHQFLDASPFQPQTIEHLRFSHTIDLDEKLFAREPCLNRRAGGPL